MPEKRLLTPEQLRKYTYSIWYGMLRRCRDKKHPKYIDYGGRGIKVCDRWNKFDYFLKDMGFRPSQWHSIERINNDGPYAPYNCKWAQMSDQNMNKRNVPRKDSYKRRIERVRQWQRRRMKDVASF